METESKKTDLSPDPEVGRWPELGRRFAYVEKENDNEQKEARVVIKQLSI